jgi:hypothetical protein
LLTVRNDAIKDRKRGDSRNFTTGIPVHGWCEGWNYLTSRQANRPKNVQITNS